MLQTWECQKKIWLSSPQACLIGKQIIFLQDDICSLFSITFLSLQQYEMTVSFSCVMLATVFASTQLWARRKYMCQGSESEIRWVHFTLDIWGITSCTLISVPIKCLYPKQGWFQVLSSEIKVIILDPEALCLLWTKVVITVPENPSNQSKFSPFPTMTSLYLRANHLILLFSLEAPLWVLHKRETHIHNMSK